MTRNKLGCDASVECEPFELQPVDFVLDKLKERREFRPCVHIGRSVLGESFLEPRRSRKHDINLGEVDSQVSSSGEPGMDCFTFLLNERMTSR
jgi:hypothetical protein